MTDRNQNELSLQKFSDNVETACNICLKAQENTFDHLISFNLCYGILCFKSEAEL